MTTHPRNMAFRVVAGPDIDLSAFAEWLVMSLHKSEYFVTEQRGVIYLADADSACLARLVYDDRITITRVAMTARCIEIGGARSMI